MMLEWIDFCCDRHDNVCNQKYDYRHPYSFHLQNVAREAGKFGVLLENENEQKISIASAWGHDLIEDTRMTYHDVRKELLRYDIIPVDEVAEVIYLCTDDKGRNRKERKSERYYNGLEENEIALFVKLCDIISNVKYSILTSNYSMGALYAREHERYRMIKSPKNFSEIFSYMDKLFMLCPIYNPNQKDFLEKEWEPRRESNDS